MVLVLPALSEILFWVGALIFIILCVYIAKALFGIAGGTLGKLPVVGGWINGGLHSLEHKIVGTMSGAAASVDAHIGAAFHRLARLVDWIGREINSHANLLATIASFLPGVATVNMVRMLAGELRRLIHAARALGVHAITQTVRVTRTVTRTVSTDVLPRLRTAEREVGHVIAHDLPRLRAADRTLTRDVTALGKWVRAHTLEAGTLAFAGAVALALGRLGIGWTRCSNVGKLGKNVCGMNPALLESLLADSLLVVGSLSLVEFAHEMVAVTDTAVRPIQGFWRVG